MADVRELLTRFDRDHQTLQNLGSAAEGVTRGVLTAHGFEPHTISHRIKSRQSLEDKIATGGYESLDEVHDLVGIRIITWFPDEVAAIGDLIRSEFTVDAANSVDKANELDPDR